MVDVPALLSIRLSRKYQLKKRKRNESAQWSANVDVSLSGDVSLTDNCKRKSSDVNDLANVKSIKIHPLIVHYRMSMKASSLVLPLGPC